MDQPATLEPRQLSGATDDDEDAIRAVDPGRIDHESDDLGQLVVKRGRGGDRSSLRREAEVIGIVGGTSLVRLVELRDGADLTELVLRDTGGPSLAAALKGSSRRPSESLHLLADACEAVARLHASGWAHGRISADHILLTSRGRIRLCSLRDAVPIDIDATVARDDRVALLRMVDDWVRAASASRPSREPVAWLTSRRVAGCTRRLADDPDPILLARILRRCGPSPGPSARAVLLGLAVAIPLAAASVAVVSRLDHPEPRAVPATTPQRSTTTAVATAATATAPGKACPAPVTSGGFDVDGDGCPDPVDIAGSTVTIGSLRFRLGGPQDAVAVGDWDCDGHATAAVLQPSTGAVHIFDRWATDSEPAVGTFAAVVDDATAISAPTDGCGPPVVTRSDDTTTQVTVP